jgi:ABC-type sugar transport system ATPase subunit
VTVLKDGKKVGTVNVKDSNMQEIINMMVGRDFELYREQNIQPPKWDDIALDVQGLCRGQEFQDISFKIRKGEILGAFGIIGSGRTEVAKAIFGLSVPDSGKIFVHGDEIRNMTSEKALRLGMGFVTENRHGEGLALALTVRENISMSILKQFAKRNILNLKKEKSIVSSYVEELDIKTPSLNFVVNNLSGGNQQKVVVAKWLAAKVDILIIDEPTRGIDVRTKSEMYRLIRGLAEEGVAILLISSELPEIMGLCHRIMVFRAGRLVNTIQNSPDITEAEIMADAVLRKDDLDTKSIGVGK